MSTTELVTSIAAGIIGLGVLMAATRSMGRAVWLLALQGALVGLVAVVAGLGLSVDHLVVAGLLAIGAKAVLVPAVLIAMLRATALRVERHPYLSPNLGALAAIALAFASSTVVEGVRIPLAPGGESALTAALATILIGLLLVMTRRKAISLLIGLFVFENGLAMAAFALTYGMPLVVELGILFDLLMAAVVGWVYTRRMEHVLGSASTDAMRRLRG